MRKGFLLTLIVLGLAGSPAVAQPLPYYPAPYPYPPAAPGYGPPLQVMVGGELRSDGPIMLPTMKGHARTLNQLPGEIIYPPQPLPRPAAPPVSPKGAPIQPTSGTNAPVEEPLPPDAGNTVG